MAQRTQADIIFDELQSYARSIFEAEEDPAGAHDLITVLEDDSTTLTALAQTRLHLLLQKIVSAGRLSQVPLEDLIRLQKLSDNAVRRCALANLRFEDSWQQSDVDEWLSQLNVADIGLKAARTCLRMLTGKREEKQLYSEEIIQNSVNALNNVLDACIVPVVELRDSGSSAGIFKLLTAHKKLLRDIVLQCQRLLAVQRDLVSGIELSDTVVNALEYTVTRLIFVENAPSEKHSILGVAKFDNLRVVAMDTLAQIFTSYVDQRQGILTEILTSLEKLPVAKQSARQFKLASGGSIQLVSALIMRLVQTSANKSDAKTKHTLDHLDLDLDAEGEDDDDIPEVAVVIRTGPVSSTFDTENRAVQQPSTSIQELRDVVEPLLNSAKNSALYVVKFIVDRAMNSTKTGDTPYRNLLDLFIVDYVTCLDSADWPASELLLRLFLIRMVSLTENDKTPAPAKNMALEVLGEMGAAISQLRSQVRDRAKSLESEDIDPQGKQLARMAEAFFEGTLPVHQLAGWEGPFKMTTVALDHKCSSEPTLHSAVGYETAHWASQVVDAFDTEADDDQERDNLERDLGRTAYRLRQMINDRRWLSTGVDIVPVSEAAAKVSYGLTLLDSQFCRAFERVLNILIRSTNSDQAAVRSRSLKSVTQVLQTDPSILDRGSFIIKHIVGLTRDSSVQVRDSALKLIDLCISLRPGLEAETIPTIRETTNDSSPAVRKRAIKLLKDIYLRNKDTGVRSSIAAALLHRVKDTDEGVQELARLTIEEIWLSPFYTDLDPTEMSPQFRLSVASHVTLMVQTVQLGDDVADVLYKVLQSTLSNSSKMVAANFRVCKLLVATMFDTVIGDATVMADRLQIRDALQLLVTFARANPKLFTNEQIQLLEPFLANVATGTDAAIFRSVIVIFRYVFPTWSTLYKDFLVRVRGMISKEITKMPKAALDDIFACQWVIAQILEDKNHLVTLMKQTLKKLQDARKIDLVKADNLPRRQIIRFLQITSMCGKNCDFDDHLPVFKETFPQWKVGKGVPVSVSKLMVDFFSPYANPSQPLDVRKAALDAIGSVCQSWPKNYDAASVSTTFQAAFEEREVELEEVIMQSFKEFFYHEERKADPDTEKVIGVADTAATLGVMGGSNHDGVSASVHRRFMPALIRIALTSQDDHALLATEILTSINRQGLNHPKELGATLIALETSQNPAIADLAFREHRSIHQKHETIMEKELMRAIQSAFTYQHDVVKDTRGATPEPFVAKLHLLLDVLNIGKVALRKRFFDKLCTRVDFDVNKLDVAGDPPEHLEFARFVIENMAYFEYATTDELLAAIAAMEKMATGTGDVVAHAIETEVLSLTTESLLNGTQSADGDTAMAPRTVPAVDPSRLRQLTVGSMILSLLWEARTHLRKLYGLMHNVTGRKESRAKGANKDLNKPPTKAAFATGDHFWKESSRIMSALESPQSMMEQCKAFVELLTVDKDFKIAAEGEDDVTAMERHTTPDEDEDEGSVPPSGGGRGRKRRAAAATPGGRKKRARSSSRGRGRAKGRRASTDSGDEDWD
jgi:cohesin loading factor subunit SCC2